MISSGDLRLWAGQIAAILRLEIKKNFLSRRAVPVYLLAGIQFVIFGLHLVANQLGWQHCRRTNDFMIYAGVFQLFYLRLAVFFGCVVVFLNLFRGEVIEKTLHYYFLTPVRREVLVVGKYIAGAITTMCIFVPTAILSYAMLWQHVAAGTSVDAGTMASHMLGYAGVTALACVGYGAFFLLLGMVFRNPIIPAILVLVWESFIAFYPPAFKKVSVIFYLESLCPVRVPFNEGRSIFAIPADPTPAFIAVPGLILLAAAVLVLAALRVRRTEISYGNE